MTDSSIRRMKDRKYKTIAIDDIAVINSRKRDKTKFEDNVRSIRDVGLYKPILVNKRNLKSTGKYELICGEGRILAHKELGRKQIKAEIVDLDAKQHQLMTLGENIARIPPQSIEYGYALKQMRDKGVDLKQMAQITGRSEEYLRDYLNLIEDGEERLIKGVEDGAFPLFFAMLAARSKDRSIQHLLMDAFDNNIVHSGNICRVRRVIEDRLEKGKALGNNGKRKKQPKEYTVQNLKRDISKITREKEAFVFRAGQKENRLFRLVEGLRTLREDPDFMSLLEQEGLQELPSLKGKYAV